MIERELLVNWVVLSLALGPRSRWLKPLLEKCHTPSEILSADKETLQAQLPELPKSVLTSLADGRLRGEAERILLWCGKNAVEVLCPDDERYPRRLFEIAEPPAVLYAKGRLPLPDGVPAVGVVGTRGIDAYGERITYKLSFELSAAGAAVISGMADGADGVAAAAALDAGGHTVAVLGCGIDIAYPRHHDRLLREIGEVGTVLTEYAPGTPPNGWNFPMRNRIISGLSDAVLVTEADEKSGALITARYAILQGKTVFAVPGDIDRSRSAGTNRLIRAGALTALTAEDVLAHFRFLYGDALSVSVPAEAMQFTEVTARKLRAHGLHVAEEGAAAAEKPPKSEKDNTVSKLKLKKRRSEPCEPTPVAVTPQAVDLLDPRQREIYEILPQEPFSTDLLVSRGLPVGDAAALLTIMELYGLLSSLPGGLYRKN
jgi:DNA processing protein